MPKVPSSFKGHKSYYEMRTEKAQKASSAFNSPSKAKIHSKAKNHSFAQKQTKYGK